MVYFNREAKKVFSVEWLDDDDKDLSQALAEPNLSGDWRIYAVQMPPQNVRAALLADIDGR